MIGRHRGATPPAKPTRPRAGLLRQKRFLIVGLVVAVALGYLGFRAFEGASMYYLTVDELLARGVAAYGEKARVMGKVVDGSVEKSPETNTVRFAMAGDQGGSLPVVYSGVVPDAFKPGADVVVEGSLTAGGAFAADSLLVKCPSKYEAKPEAQGTGGRE